MAALAQHGTAVFLADGLRGLLHIGGIFDGHAGEYLCLGDVRGQHLRHRQQPCGQCIHGIVPQQLGAGGCHHNGVHHNVLGAVLLQLVGDRADQLCRGYHTNLDGIGVDVGKDRVKLLGQKMWGRLKNVGHAGRVLGSQGRDGAHGKNAVSGHRLDICLDTGASAGITSSNGQCCFHRNTSFLSVQQGFITRHKVVPPMYREGGKLVCRGQGTPAPAARRKFTSL